MFGRKKKKEEHEELQVDIQTMPPIFYGGNDPDIYKHQEVDAGTPPQPQQAQKGGPPPPVQRTQQSKSSLPSSPEARKRKKILIIVIAVVSTVVLAGISWYYVSQFYDAREDRDTTSTTVPEKPTEEKEEPVTPTSSEQTAPTTSTEATSETEVEVPESLAIDATLSFPAIVQSDTVDIDSDQLTDKEEALFETDSGGFDTDGDGYFDGQEVFNLYDPKGAAPSRLIDSGLVREYVNPSSRYRLYHPLSWQVGSVDTVGNHVLFSNVEGDFIEIRTFAISPGEQFNTWFGKHVKGQRITDIVKFKNRFKVDAWKRRDDLVAYFMDETNVHVVIFQPAELGPVSYRHVMKMLVQSFRFASTTEALPEQVVIPGANSSITPDAEEEVVIVETATSTEPVEEDVTTSTVQ